MKKLSKSMLTLIIVLSLLFAMAITVFAAHYTTSGEFKSKFGSGKYGVTMTLTDDRATASLSISDYFGVVEEGGGAIIKGRVRAGNHLSEEYPTRVGENIYKASLTIDRSYFDPDYPYQEFICDYTFYKIDVTNYVLDNK